MSNLIQLSCLQPKSLPVGRQLNSGLLLASFTDNFVAHIPDIFSMLYYFSLLRRKSTFGKCDERAGAHWPRLLAFVHKAGVTSRSIVEILLRLSDNH